jgi:hypothetical protein
MSKRVLPAVLMALANASGLATSVWAPANGATAPLPTTDSVKPIAAMFTANDEALEPARLTNWANALALSVGSPEDLGRCGTISGSAGGWDDSKQDC